MWKNLNLLSLWVITEPVIFSKHFLLSATNYSNEKTPASAWDALIFICCRAQQVPESSLSSIYLCGSVMIKCKQNPIWHVITQIVVKNCKKEGEKNFYFPYTLSIIFLANISSTLTHTFFFLFPCKVVTVHSSEVYFHEKAGSGDEAHFCRKTCAPRNSKKISTDHKRFMSCSGKWSATLNSPMACSVHSALFSGDGLWLALQHYPVCATSFLDRMEKKPHTDWISG